MDTKIVLIVALLLLIFLLIIFFMVYKPEPVKVKNLDNNKNEGIKQNTLTDDEKILIKEYFKKLDDYLEGFFLRKYILSFMSITLPQIEELKLKYKDINCTEVLFPLPYSDISSKNLSLAKFLKSEYSNELNSNDLLVSESLIEEIKKTKIANKHKIILEELKKYNLDEYDQINWKKLYDLEPIAIVN